MDQLSVELTPQEVQKALAFQKFIIKSDQMTELLFDRLSKLQKIRQKESNESQILIKCRQEFCNKTFKTRQAYAGHFKTHKLMYNSKEDGKTLNNCWKEDSEFESVRPNRLVDQRKMRMNEVNSFIPRE